MMLTSQAPYTIAVFPEAYTQIKSGRKIMGRVSEYEPACMLFQIFLIDPLAKWTPDVYERLINTTELNHELYIMMPSMHGHLLDTDKAVLDVCRKYDRVVGLITKYPEKLQEYLDSTQ